MPGYAIATSHFGARINPTAVIPSCLPSSATIRRIASSSKVPRIERNINLPRLCARARRKEREREREREGEEASARRLLSLRRGPAGWKLTLRNNLVVNSAYNNAGVVSLLLPYPTLAAPFGILPQRVGGTRGYASDRFLPSRSHRRVLSRLFIYSPTPTCQPRSTRNNPRPTGSPPPPPPPSRRFEIR